VLQLNDGSHRQPKRVSRQTVSYVDVIRRAPVFDGGITYEAVLNFKKKIERAHEMFGLGPVRRHRARLR